MMTVVELLLTVLFFSVLAISVIVGFIQTGRENDARAFVISLLSLLVLMFFLTCFSYLRGALNPATDHDPTSLQEGILYENVCSQKKVVIDNTNNSSEEFMVWLSWNSGQYNALYVLKEDPPRKFTKDSKGELIAVAE